MLCLKCRFRHTWARNYFGWVLALRASYTSYFRLDFFIRFENLFDSSRYTWNVLTNGLLLYWTNAKNYNWPLFWLIINSLNRRGSFVGFYRLRRKLPGHYFFIDGELKEFTKALNISRFIRSCLFNRYRHWRFASLIWIWEKTAFLRFRFFIFFLWKLGGWLS